MIRTSGLIARAMALAALAGIVGLLWVGVLRPLASWRADVIGRSIDTVDDIAHLEQSILQLRTETHALGESESAGLTWSAKEAGQASALVQSRLANLAQTEGLAFRSVAPLQGRDLPIAGGVGFRVELEAPLDRLVAFLVAVENSRPVLIIERASLRRLQRPEAAAGDSQAASGQPEVFVQLDVIAPVQVGQKTGEDET